MRRLPIFIKFGRDIRYSTVNFFNRKFLLAKSTVHRTTAFNLDKTNIHIVIVKLKNNSDKNRYWHLDSPLTITDFDFVLWSQ